MSGYTRRRSWIWFLLPVFIQIIGGLIAYYALKPDEPRMAKDCLYIGITLSAINIGTFLILVGSGIAFDQMMMADIQSQCPWCI